MAYVCFFGDKEHDKRAESAKIAVMALFSYLDHHSKAYLRSPTAAVRDRTQIVCDMGRTVEGISLDEAIRRLGSQDEIKLFVTALGTGIFESASAIDETLYEAAACLDARVVAVQKHNAAKKHNALGAEMNRVKKLMLPIASEPAWHPSTVAPLHILQAAEERLFAYHLVGLMQSKGISGTTIEAQLDFAPGTIERCLKGIKPLRPTKTMIEQIARCLNVSPDDLWFDAVEAYHHRKSH